MHVGFETGVDQVVGYKEDNRNQGKNNSSNQKSRMQELRKDNPKHHGESDQDWNNRLQELYREENRRD